MELIRLAYGEHIIRCYERDPNVIEDFLSMDGEVEKAWKWLALARAKREGEAGHIRGLLIYLVSNYVGQPDEQKREWLIQRIEKREIRLRDLTYEILKGTHLDWEHIFKLVGKEFNPTRTKERVQRAYEELSQAGKERSYV